MAETKALPPAPEKKLTTNEKIATFKAFIERPNQMKALNDLLPKHLSAERVVKVVLASYNKTPRLRECTMQSIFLSMLTSAELGLEPNSALGHAYLVPYLNKVKGPDGKPTGKKQYEAQFIIGYKGLIHLANRSGEVPRIQARCVYANEHCEVRYGTNPGIDHRPIMDSAKRGPLIAVYSVAWNPAGDFTLELMTKGEVDLVRARSMAKDNGPWVTDYPQMAEKTVLKRHLKRLPLSKPDLAEALDKVEAAEREEDEIDVTPVAPPKKGTAVVPELDEHHEQAFVEFDSEEEGEKVEVLREAAEVAKEGSPKVKKVDAPEERQPGDDLTEVEEDGKQLAAEIADLSKRMHAAAEKGVAELQAVGAEISRFPEDVQTGAQLVYTKLLKQLKEKK